MQTQSKIITPLSVTTEKNNFCLAGGFFLRKKSRVPQRHTVIVLNRRSEMQQNRNAPSTGSEMARFFQVREGKRKANAECKTCASLCSPEKREKN